MRSPTTGTRRRTSPATPRRRTTGRTALSCSRPAALRAFTEYLPVRRDPLDPDRIHAAFRYGPALETFRIDMRSYRGPKTATTRPTGARDDDPRSRPAPLAEAGAAGLGRYLEGDRGRHAARPDRATIRARCSPKRSRKARTARRAGASSRSRACSASSATPRSPTWSADCGRALHRSRPLRPEPGAVPGVRAVLGLRLGAAKCRHLRADRLGLHLRPSGRVPEGAVGGPANLPLSAGLQSSARCTSTATAKS